MKRRFYKELYCQRNKNETILSVVKRMFGECILSRSVRMQNRELFFRVIAYNMHRLTVFLVWFLQSQSFIMLKYACKTTQSMNKLAIPSILAATVLIAGIFAFMPVEKASTVHTGLAEKIDAVQNDVGVIKDTTTKLMTLELTDAELEVEDMYTLVCDKDYTVIGILANVRGQVGYEDIYIIVTTGGVEVSENSEKIWIKEGAQLFIEKNIPVIAGGNVVLTVTEEKIDYYDQEVDLTISVLAPNNAECKISQTPTSSIAN